MEISKININNSVKNSYIKREIAFRGQKQPLNSEDKYFSSKPKESKSAGLLQKVKSLLKQTSSEKTAVSERIDSLDAALKAGHEMGRSYCRDGKWYIYDKTINAFIEDTTMQKKVEKAFAADTGFVTPSTKKRRQMLFNKYGQENLTVDDWNSIINDEYRRIRHVGKYAIDYGSNNYSDNIRNINYEIINPSNPYVKTLYQSPWIFRLSKYIRSEDVGQRVSLNVKGDSRLIKNLDRLMTKGEYVDDNGNLKRINLTEFYYKTYQGAESWGLRSDPVTIYFKGNVNPETLNAIVQITKRFVRGTIDGADNNTPWLTVEQDPTISMISEVIKKAENLDKNLTEAIKQNSNNGELCSCGYLKAFKNIIAEYCEYLKMIN